MFRIMPLEEYRQAFVDFIGQDSLLVRTVPPVMVFDDGSNRWVIAPGNAAGRLVFAGNLLLDVRTVRITEEIEFKPELPDFYPDVGQASPSQTEQPIQTVHQTSEPPSDHLSRKRVRRARKRGKDKDGIQTAFHYLTEHGDHYSVRGLAKAAGVTAYAADRALHNYREFRTGRPVQ